jgi:hypothetical protein
MSLANNAAPILAHALTQLLGSALPGSMAFKVGGGWRFSCAEINSWIKQQSMEGFETSREQDGDATGQPNNGERK